MSGIDVVAGGNGAGGAVASSDAAPSSVLARLRKQVDEQRKVRTLDVPIGGAFDPPLIVRYGTLDVDTLERYSELAQGSSNVELMFDLMTRCCRAILARDGDELIELADEQGAVVYGPRLAALLGMPLHEGDVTPRETILMLFGGNGMALATHAQELVTWMQNPGGPSPGEASALER